jgi:HlyD family secretion protein
VRTIITAGIACVVTLAGVGGWWAMSSRGKAEAPTPVRIEAPLRGDLVEVVGAPGVVEPKTKVSISARVSARVMELPFREGQIVTKGDPNAQPPVKPSLLVKLDDKDLQAMLRSAKAQHSAQAAQLEVAKARLLTQAETIKSVQATLRDAKRDLERQQELFKSEIVTETVIDQARTMVERRLAEVAIAETCLKADQLNLLVLSANVAAAEEEVNRCTENLTYTEIVSPIDGIVTRVKAEVGELVVTGTMNNPGTEILQVADLSKMLVVAQLDEGDVGQVRVGQPAKVTIRAYRDQAFTGTVDSIALVQTAGLAGRAGYFEVKILLATAQRVYSGLSADVEIETRRHAGVLKVPSQSILSRRVDELPAAVRDGNPNVVAGKTETPVVYRVIDGQTVVTPVKIGPADATHTVILAGLEEKDKVVVGPYKVLEQLKHEQKVADDRKGATSRPTTSSGPTSSPVGE